jgi:hypothetical protein
VALDFIVLGLPRSGTTWASVWLDCPHDPLYSKHYTEWDAQPWQGVSCTGIWRWPEWVNAHSARKLILVRDRLPRQTSLQLALGSGYIAQPSEVLTPIDGRRAYWSDIFDPVRARQLWEYLRPDVPFDFDRHARLKHINMKPELSLIDRNLPLQQRLRDELGPGAQ